MSEISKIYKAYGESTGHTYLVIFNNFLMASAAAEREVGRNRTEVTVNMNRYLLKEYGNGFLVAYGEFAKLYMNNAKLKKELEARRGEFASKTISDAFLFSAPVAKPKDSPIVQKGTSNNNQNPVDRVESQSGNSATVPGNESKDAKIIISSLKSALFRDPFDKKGWNLLGDAFKEIGDMANAEACYDRASSLDSKPSVKTVTNSSVKLSSGHKNIDAPVSQQTNQSKLDAALAKLTDSVKDYQYTPDDRRVCLADPWYLTQYYRCLCCNKKVSIEIMYGMQKDPEIVDRYAKLADEFTKLGYPASFKAFCENCVKQFPFEQRNFGERYYHGHNFVFFVTRPDYEDPVCSFPYSDRFDDEPYRIALAFLSGADTISKLAEATKTKLPAERYLFYIKRILFE